ncbi:hypothetical protein [Paenibacillus sp. Y412MC10]|uniref:hypothetical protein n=1 Tax=Geobacillus sp. (strain Y412MC10) TaxID=481743 RepID=UPI001C93030B|nr:hypothetical protein [Paenibacillus sp. Y412MC10]
MNERKEWVMKLEFWSWSVREGVFDEEEDGICCFVLGSVITVGFDAREIRVEMEYVN